MSWAFVTRDEVERGLGHGYFHEVTDETEDRVRLRSLRCLLFKSSSVAHRRTFGLTDPAPVTPAIQPRRHRGKAYLAGTAKEVWVPDPLTQERRDWFHAHRKAVKRATQVRNRLKSFLSDNAVRLAKGTRLAQDTAQVQERLRLTRQWSPRQWQVIQLLLLELHHADQQRHRWRSLITQEVLSDPLLLSMVRLCGVREIVASAMGAFIGDIKRFSSPAKLVKYVGLNPAFDDSGEGKRSGGIGGHGRADLRSLLVEGAQAILRTSQSHLAQWGRKLLRRKGEIKLVVAALARKLTVAIWYLLMGRWTPLEHIDERLSMKVSKMITAVGTEQLDLLGMNRTTYREQTYLSLKVGRVYVLDPDKKFVPRAMGQPVQVAPATASAERK